MKAEGKSEGVVFDIWGCRGSRSLVPPRSKIGNNTSCYSIVDGEDIFVFDAGRGLASLATALVGRTEYPAVQRVHVFVTHGHMDHWEGLKDSDWFWCRGNNLSLTIYAVQEAMEAIQRGYRHPAFVDLERLANGTLAQLSYRQFGMGDTIELNRSWTIQSFPLNHYSGTAQHPMWLHTSAYRLARADGPVISYLSDHEPTDETLPVERNIIRDADVVVYDAHFANRRDQTFGHGSQEHAAAIAREQKALVFAAHHGPMYSDEQIKASFRQHGKGLRNFHLAVEGKRFSWDERRKRFHKVKSRNKTGIRGK